MAAAAIALADLGQIHQVRGVGPGIGAHRHLAAEAALAQAHAVDALRVQIVRDELVVAFELLIGEVVEHGALAGIGALAHNLNRALVAGEQRLQQRRHERLLQHRGQRMVRQQRHQPRHEGGILRSFDDHGQPHGGLAHLHCAARVWEQGAVDDVRPLDQLGCRRGMKAEALLGHRSQELGAALEVGIVELGVGLLLLEVGRVGGGKESALVVVEPPGDARRRGVLEVHDRVLVAIELGLVEQAAGAMHQTAEDELGVVANALAIKARKQRRARRPVETLIVKKHPDPQTGPLSLFSLSAPKAGHSSPT